MPLRGIPYSKTYNLDVLRVVEKNHYTLCISYVMIAMLV